MAVLSRMERMLADRRSDEADPVLDEYNNPMKITTFSTRFVLVMCVILFFFIVALFLPLKSQIMGWTRLGFVITAILSFVALLFDRATHLHH